MTAKQRLGAWAIPRLPVTRHVFNHLRLELRGSWVRLRNRIDPRIRAVIRSLRSRQGLLVNVGCGPFGVAGWVNLDLYWHHNVTLVADCRRSLPLSDRSCVGIHVEMFLEHLNPVEECPEFLTECYRCLIAGGVLRIIVPDGKKFLHAYFTEGWEEMNRISYGFEDWEEMFGTKMNALNHVFIQEWEHYGGWDAERLRYVLAQAGFTRFSLRAFGEGEFPVAPIDREFHRQNGLYFEAQR